MDEKKSQMDLIHRTHDIFVGIIGKDLVLRMSAPPGRTDCETYISIPPEDPQADLIHKHELQHCVFGSDLRARAEFVNTYVSKLTTKNSRLTPFEPGLKEFIHLFINALDDLRVCSLWSKPYPQSADDIMDRWRDLIMQTGNYEKDLIHYTMAIGLGLRPPMLGTSVWSRFTPLLEEATQKVMNKGFVACLVTAKWILDRMIGDVIQSLMPPPQLDVIVPGPQGYQKPRLATRAGGASRPPLTTEQLVKKHETQEQQASMIEKLLAGVAPANGKFSLRDTPDIPQGTGDWVAIQNMVNAAMGVSTDDQIKYMLQQSELEMTHIIQAIQGARRQTTVDERLLKDIDGDVTFRDVRRNELNCTELTKEDLRTINSLKHTFSKLMQKRRRKVSDSGSTLDPSRYVDFLTGSGDAEFFEEESRGKGFSALILLDMSNSMTSKWETVERACKVLAKSMKFPFATLEVWGFSSSSIGRITLYRFKDTEHGYSGDGVVGAWGMTPLHSAIKVAARRAEQMPGHSQNLFVLTDGHPSFETRSGVHSSTTQLMQAISKIVRDARYKKVNVSGLILGNDVDDKAAALMFGRHWKRVTDRGLFEGLVGLVNAAFLGYMKRS